MAFDDLAPTVKIEVEGQELSADVTRAIQKVEVDLARDIADQITLVVANPIRDELGVGYKDADFVFLDSKAFQPGNTIKVSMGYGEFVDFVGAGIISKWLPDFPANGSPTLTIKAIDASIRMMDGELSQEAATFDNFDLDTIVREIIGRHEIVEGQIDPLPGTGAGRTMLKKRGMSDYIYIKGLANLAGFEFAIRLNPDTDQWECFWRAPVSDQERQFTFRYNAGAETTLLTLSPQWGLRDQPTAVKVFYLDPTTRTWEEVTVEDVEEGEKLRFEGGDDRILEAINSSGSVRIAAGGIAIEVVSERRFDSLDQAVQFAERWLRARKDLFVTGNGSTIGVAELRPGDVHIFEGIGTQLTGDWELTTVRHVFDVNRGFRTEFFAHKVVE